MTKDTICQSSICLLICKVLTTARESEDNTWLQVGPRVENAPIRVEAPGQMHDRASMRCRVCSRETITSCAGSRKGAISWTEDFWMTCRRPDIYCPLVLANLESETVKSERMRLDPSQGIPRTSAFMPVKAYVSGDTLPNW